MHRVSCGQAEVAYTKVNAHEEQVVRFQNRVNKTLGQYNVCMLSLLQISSQGFLRNHPITFDVSSYDCFFASAYFHD
jgi:hypothetical protein